MDNVVPFRPRSVAHREPEPLWREALGQQLRSERRERGERIADVAERAGISAQYLSELERGCKDPSSEMLAAVAGALGLTVRELGVLTVSSVLAVASGPLSVGSVSVGSTAVGSQSPRGALCLAA